jgi:hypothetical protein
MAMSIAFECSCGKKMSAKEEFAGRRLRCPDCQRVLTIPKSTAAGMMPMPANPAKAPSSQLLTQPTLTKSEVAALELTRPTIPETSLKPKSPDFDSPENLAALFNTLSKTPVLAPSPPAVPKAPFTPRPDDEMAATQVGLNTEPLAPVENVWVDQSLQQTATPWRPGDEQRFQAGVAPAREWDWPVEWMAAILVVAATLLFAA